MALLVLDSVRSTMDAARDLLHSGRWECDAFGRPTPAGVLALDQTAGRGQRGRTWFSKPGESMCCTFLLPLHPQEMQNPGWLALAAGAAALRSVEAYRNPDLPASAWQLALKWPNDLLLNGKKLGGVLIEILTSGIVAQPMALVGIGINLSCTQFPEDISLTPTSITLEGGTVPDAVEAGERTCDLLWDELGKARELGVEAAMETWRAYDGTRGRRYSVANAHGTVEGTAIGIDVRGSLLIATSSGEVLSVHSAAVLAETPVDGGA
jgi:BirA family transcriptional regulator, biotin operon repressor / biotin---[acetyl-CoA-carboxylase] ligase